MAEDSYDEPTGRLERDISRVIGMLGYVVEKRIPGLENAPRPLDDAVTFLRKMKIKYCLGSQENKREPRIKNAFVFGD
jgi:hypothetical protein